MDVGLRSAALYVRPVIPHPKKRFVPRFDIRARPSTTSGTYSTITFYSATPKASRRDMGAKLDKLD